MEQDFLQTIRLEISRTFELTPYERMAFHRILGIARSENGMKVLLREASKPGFIRKSALKMLIDFAYPETDEFFKKLIAESALDDELAYALEFYERNGGDFDCSILIRFFLDNLTNVERAALVSRAIYITGLHCTNKEQIEKLSVLAVNHEVPVRHRCVAIESLALLKEISFFEKLLEEKNDQINSAVFRTLSILGENEMKKYKPSSNDLFSRIPPQEDQTIVLLRVLLSKYSTSFDDFSINAKLNYLLALVMSNHREFTVFISRILSSDKRELIDTTLYLLLANCTKIFSPDTLFRSLIAHPGVTERDNDIIVEIFYTYFKHQDLSRTSGMFRDKIFNYIIVTLDTLFENYRTNYMIPEIIEKDYTAEYQQIRKFILNRLNPHLKRRLLKFLTTEDITLKNLLIEISEHITWVVPEDNEKFRCFLEMLNERDPKAREIAASRINDIDFEKRNIRNRIIRLCKIIGRLGLNDASSNLIKMFNYIKKHHDQEILDQVIHSLSLLNYPFILTELETSLSYTDDDPLRQQTLHYLSLYSDQRSLNILLDFAASHYTENSATIQLAMQKIKTRDIKLNRSANETAKMLLGKSRDVSIRASAVHIIGKTGFEDDIAFLHRHFFETKDNPVKETIIHAIDSLARLNPSIKKTQITALLREYMKDPSIRVRIFACLLLLQYGDKSALFMLRDMMVIKNRDIQRDILLLLGGYITIELAYFFISILRDEYAITDEIIPLLKFLQPEDRTEIDYFIVNIFRKHEGSGYEHTQAREIEENQKHIQEMKKFSEVSFPLLFIKVNQYYNILTRYQTTDLSMIFGNLFKKCCAVVLEHGGTVSRSTGGFFICFFKSAAEAASSAFDLRALTRDFNAGKTEEDILSIFFFLQFSDTLIINNELFEYNIFEYKTASEIQIADRILVNKPAAETLSVMFNSEPYPSAALVLNGKPHSYFELMNVANYNMLSEEIFASFKKTEIAQRELERTLHESPVDHSGENSKLSSAFDDVGRSLKKDLSELLKYVKKRSTDREMIKRVEELTQNIHKHYQLEASKYWGKPNS